MTYEIKKGVPMPKQTANAKYPFKRMEKGDCFEFPINERKRVVKAACMAALRMGSKVVFRSAVIDESKAGIWRVA